MKVKLKNLKSQFKIVESILDECEFWETIVTPLDVTGCTVTETCINSSQIQTSAKS